MKIKYVVMIFATVTGLVGAASASQWPNHASLIQMVLYSVMVLGLLFLSFWSDRGRREFWKGIAFVVLLHAVFLLLIRSLFPFKTILIVLPMAITEGVVAATLFLRVSDY
jgi:cytochrome bd-type quinol oxidase subunit 2